MAQHRCPYWLGYLLNNPLRRVLHNPEKILRPLVAPGMTALDIGSAMGFFALPLARMVGPNGKVVCVDVQEKMLQALHKNACKAGLSNRIVTRVCKPDSLNLDGFEGTVNFAIAFAVVHEISDAGTLFAEVFQSLKPGAECLIAEPKGHVSAQDFAQSLLLAEQAGLRTTATPSIPRCHTALLCKK
jgi:ubiquinone/menaquinone biosynthesis C-methylase UbiE